MREPVTSSSRWVPPVVQSLLRDPEIGEALAAPPSRPQTRVHRGVPLPPELPAGWTPDQVVDHVEMLVDRAEIWSSVHDVFVYQTERSILPMQVVVAGGLDEVRRVLGVHLNGRASRRGHGDISRAQRLVKYAAERLESCLRRIFDGAGASGEWHLRFVNHGGWLNYAGAHAQTVLWLVHRADSVRVALPEYLYALLHALALTGHLDVPGWPEDPEQLIATAWSRAFPVTWGIEGVLATSLVQPLQPLRPVPPAATPTLVEAARRHLAELTSASVAGLVGEEDGELIAAIDPAHPPARLRRTAGDRWVLDVSYARVAPETHLDSRTAPGRYTWAARIGPRNVIAGVALVMALCEAARGVLRDPDEGAELLPTCNAVRGAFLDRQILAQFTVVPSSIDAGPIRDGRPRF